MMGTLWKTALKNSFGTALYISAVGSFMFWGGEAKLGRSRTFLVPVALLLLFVSSAALTGFLLFGKPVQLYIDGKKKESLTLLTYTLASFFTITIVFLGLLVLFTR